MDSLLNWKILPRIVGIIFLVSTRVPPTTAWGAWEEDRSSSCNSNSMCRQGDLYMRDQGLCYNHGSQGPCGKCMKVMPDGSGNPMGRCKCKDVPCMGRPMVYVPEAKRCHHIYDQGPCYEGEWLAIDERTNKVCCQKIPCYEWFCRQEKPNDYDDADMKFLFPYKNKCYETMTTGFPLCRRGEKVYIDPHSFLPRCFRADDGCGNNMGWGCDKDKPSNCGNNDCNRPPRPDCGRSGCDSKPLYPRPPDRPSISVGCGGNDRDCDQNMGWSSRDTPVTRIWRVSEEKKKKK